MLSACTPEIRRLLSEGAHSAASEGLMGALFIPSFSGPDSSLKHLPGILAPLPRPSSILMTS